jgi:hypothetical protein
MKMASWILAGTFAFVLLPASLAAQALPDNPKPTQTDSARTDSSRTGPADWARVQDLVNGEIITVARPGEPSLPCRFAGATNDFLFCDSFSSQRQFRFTRAEVNRVRSEDKRRNVTIVVCAFTAAGFIWGTAAPRDPGSSVPRVLVGFAGAGLGALAGAALALPASLLIPGRLIYHRHVSDRTSKSNESKSAPVAPDPLPPQNER